MPGYTTHPTPNPNSLKIVRTDGQPVVPAADLGGGGMLSFTSAAEAADHPLGAALFSVPGVAGVFALGTFLTVTKASAARWDDVLPGVEALLHAFEA